MNPVPGPRSLALVPLGLLFVALAGLLPLAAIPATAATRSAAPAAAPEPQTTPDGFPATKQTAAGLLTVYQPQLDSWDGYRLKVHAACSVLPAGSKVAIFGVVFLQANTQVDKPARSVLLYDTQIVKVSFPSAPDKAAQFQAAFAELITPEGKEIALDRLEADLAISKAEIAQLTQPVRNEPPQIIFSQTSAVLVHVDGDPVWIAVEGTPFERVLNTHSLLLRQKGNSDVFLHLLGGWMAAPGLAGPWVVASFQPPGADALAQKLAQEGIADLMDAKPDPSDPQARTPSLTTSSPTIIVATKPTEVVVTEGTPDWVPLEGTNLLYVKNSTANIFMDMQNQKMYVLISGRWFVAGSSAGPWTFVPPNSLPSDFAHIPDTSPKENVKACVPGTAQAREAVISAQVPQTAVVYVDKATFDPKIDGEPVMKPIDGTSMSYVANSTDPLIEVGPMQWYAVKAGVWYTASAAAGPWHVALSVPPAIYTIPTSSPLHYVTYVQIYDATPTYVVVGYTSGYMGTVITPSGTVVYGTGYAYPPYIGGSVWVPPPPTYGYAVGMAYTPWTGWGYGYGVGWGWGAATVGFGIGWAMATAPCWGPMPYYYHPYYGYGGAAVGMYGAAAWGAQRLGRDQRQHLPPVRGDLGGHARSRRDTTPGPATPGPRRSATRTTRSRGRSRPASAPRSATPTPATTPTSRAARPTIHRPASRRRGARGRSATPTAATRPTTRVARSRDPGEHDELRRGPGLERLRRTRREQLLRQLRRERLQVQRFVAVVPAVQQERRLGRRVGRALAVALAAVGRARGG